jgi:hypothetical protein
MINDFPVTLKLIFNLKYDIFKLYSQPSNHVYIRHFNGVNIILKIKIKIFNKSFKGYTAPFAKTRNAGGEQLDKTINLYFYAVFDISSCL